MILPNGRLAQAKYSAVRPADLDLVNMADRPQAKENRVCVLRPVRIAGDELPHEPLARSAQGESRADR